MVGLIACEIEFNQLVYLSTEISTAYHCELFFKFCFFFLSFLNICLHIFAKIIICTSSFYSEIYLLFHLYFYLFYLPQYVFI